MCVNAFGCSSFDVFIFTCVLWVLARIGLATCVRSRFVFGSDRLMMCNWRAAYQRVH